MFPTISSKIGATLKGKNFFLREHVVSFKCSPYDKGGNILIGKEIFFIAFFTRMRKMCNESYAYDCVNLKTPDT